MASWDPRRASATSLLYGQGGGGGAPPRASASSILPDHSSGEPASSLNALSIMRGGHGNAAQRAHERMFFEMAQRISKVEALLEMACGGIERLAGPLSPPPPRGAPTAGDAWSHKAPGSPASSAPSMVTAHQVTHGPVHPAALEGEGQGERAAELGVLQDADEDVQPQGYPKISPMSTPNLRTRPLGASSSRRLYLDPAAEQPGSSSSVARVDALGRQAPSTPGSVTGSAAGGR